MDEQKLISLYASLPDREKVLVAMLDEEGEGGLWSVPLLAAKGGLCRRVTYTVLHALSEVVETLEREDEEDERFNRLGRQYRLRPEKRDEVRDRLIAKYPGLREYFDRLRLPLPVLAAREVLDSVPEDGKDRESYLRRAQAFLSSARFEVTTGHVRPGQKDEVLRAIAELEKKAEIAPEEAALPPPTEPQRRLSKDGRYTVRLYDGFDNEWTDVLADIPWKDAVVEWNKRTRNGTKNTTFGDIDYYDIFPADTTMIFS